MKQKKSILLTGALVAVLSASFFWGGMMSSKRAEVRAEEIGITELNERSEKEMAAESDSFINTSTEYAKHLLSDYPDSPLLGDSSLESMVNDVNAGHNAKEVILAVCEANGIPAETAVISDLTVEQIVEIDRTVFMDSDHPLGE